jgi:Glycosyl hydrolase family 85
VVDITVWPADALLWARAAVPGVETLWLSVLQAWMCLGEGRLGAVAWLLAMQSVLPTPQACGILGANLPPLLVAQGCQAADPTLIAGVSAALFAPGWVSECGDPDTFEQRQEDFWSRIDSAVQERRPCPLTSAFLSTFCQGCGTATFDEVCASNRHQVLVGYCVVGRSQ